MVLWNVDLLWKTMVLWKKKYGNTVLEQIYSFRTYVYYGQNMVLWEKNDTMVKTVVLWEKLWY